MSAQKMREVVRQIQGMNALQAVAVLGAVPRKSARIVAKTLKSAIANAEHNNAKPESLIVKVAVAGQSTMKRFIPKARGSAGPILKRTCHVKIVVQILANFTLWDKDQSNRPSYCLEPRLALQVVCRQKILGGLLAEDHKIRSILKRNSRLLLCPYSDRKSRDSSCHDSHGSSRCGHRTQRRRHR